MTRRLSGVRKASIRESLATHKFTPANDFSSLTALLRNFATPKPSLEAGDRSGIRSPHLKVRAQLIVISEKQYQAPAAWQENVDFS
jgi:hypothetical protein